MSDARWRFVAAMRDIKGCFGEDENEDFTDKVVGDACDAFADAVCESGSDVSTCHLATEGTPGEHIACCAALRKEVGL